MALSDKDIEKHIKATINARLQSSNEERTEAMKDFLSISMPTADLKASEKIAEMVPPVLPDLYEKWIGLFIESLKTTMPAEVLQELCAGDDENNAALVLVYIMFLESARMEKQIAEDLSEYGLAHSGQGDMGDVAADYIRAQMTALAEHTKGPSSTDKIQ